MNFDIPDKDARIDPNGESHILDEPAEYYTLEYLQSQVEGYIEMVLCPFSRDHVGVANEEGVCRDMPYNETASILFERPLVGPVLFIRKDRMK